MNWNLPDPGETYKGARPAGVRDAARPARARADVWRAVHGDVDGDWCVLRESRIERLRTWTPVDPCLPLDLLPPGCRAYVLAEKQAQYINLPSVRTPDGKVVTRWRLTPAELASLVAGSDVYLITWTFGHPFQPVALTVGAPDLRD